MKSLKSWSENNFPRDGFKFECNGFSGGTNGGGAQQSAGHGGFVFVDCGGGGQLLGPFDSAEEKVLQQQIHFDVEVSVFIFNRFSRFSCLTD